MSAKKMTSEQNSSTKLPEYDPANIDQFYFICDDLQKTDVTVKGFYGTEEISRLFNFEITLTSENRHIPADSLLGKDAALLIYKKGFCYSFTGIISSFSFLSSNTDYSEYKVILSPRLHFLTLSRQSRIFQKMTIPDIIKAILLEHGINNGFEFKITTSNFKQKEYVVQYEESDYNFICRLMESCGLFYYIEEDPFELTSSAYDPKRSKLIITDTSSNCRFLPVDPLLEYKNRSGLIQSLNLSTQDHIFELQATDQVIAGKVIVKSYNYRTPDVNLQESASIQDGQVGQYYEFGGDLKNSTEAVHRAKILSKRISSKKHFITGESFCRGLRSAYRTEVSFNDDNNTNIVMLLTRITHKCTSVNNATSENKLLYTNEFVAVSVEKINDYLPDFEISKPRIPGILPGIIEAAGSEYATLDDLGRYKVRMPYDLSDTDNYDGSKYLRIAQPYSGPDYGMHFPSHENAEVIIGHINNNPDKPIGLGTVPNANTISPVTSNNKECSSIKTAGNNELTMNDTDGRQQMNASTPYDMSISAGNNQCISVANNRTVSVGNDEKKEISGNQKETIDGNVEESTEGSKSVKIAGDSTVSVSATAERTYRAKRSTTINGNETESLKSSLSIEVASGNSEEYSADHAIKAASNIINISKGPLTIKSSGNIDITAGSMAATESMNINIIGTASVVLKVGGTSITASAAGVKIESSGKVIISGSLVSSTGGIMLVSGLPVNIN